MSLLGGKRILVTGVLTEASIAFSVARLAQQEGAEILLTGFGRGLSITRRAARRLASPPDVQELDVTRPDQVAALARELDHRWGRIDGVVHAVAFAPPNVLGGRFLAAEWDDVATTVQVSAYSLVALCRSFKHLLRNAGGGAVVGLDFDASVAWSTYDWMGVAKACLESCCRYLARDLGCQGTRVNLVAAGPLRTPAASAIPNGDKIAEGWHRRAPLGWDATNAEPVARVVCGLLSDWMPSVTGEIVHADGGAHAMGSPIRGDEAPPFAADR